MMECDKKKICLSSILVAFSIDKHAIKVVGFFTLFKAGAFYDSTSH